MTAWSARAAAELDIAWLLDAIAPAGEIGRRMAAEVQQVFGPGDEAAALEAIRAVHETASSLRPERVDAMRTAFAAMPDPAAAVARAALGDVLDDVSLFELARFSEAAARVREAAHDAGRAELTLPELDRALASSLALGRSESGGFYLDGRFDDRLTAARERAHEADAAFASARDRLAARIAETAGLDSIRSGEFILMRDRVKQPPASVRVIRETPAYFLCELILDAAALDRLEDRDAARAAVAAIEEDVRRRLSESVRRHEEALVELRAAAGRADCFLGRVRFAQSHQGCVPEIAAGASIELIGATLLPLQARLREARRAYVPISFAVEGAAVVTGPNMGGKSAALRTCGFVAACAVLGVPLPAQRARIALFDVISWIGLGAETPDRQERTLLSGFGREVVDLRDALARGAARRLVLLDEFARTTTPGEGAALLIAVLERLRESGACALAATHLPAIARRSGALHFAVAGPRELPRRDGAPLDLEAALAFIGDVMDYRLVRVEDETPGPGDAIALAGILGLEASIIDRAEREMTGR